MDQRWAVMFNSRASTRASCERGACQSLGCQHLHHGRVHACSVGEPFARPTLLRDCSLHMCRPEATQVLPSEHLFNLCRWNASEVWGKATAHTTALHKRPGRSFRWSAITDGAPTMCLTCGFWSKSDRRSLWCVWSWPSCRIQQNSAIWWLSYLPFYP